VSRLSGSTRVALAFAAALLVAGALAAGLGAAAPEASPSRIIDRTLVCTVAERAGVRVQNETELVSAAAGAGDAGSVSIGRNCTSLRRKVSLTSRGLSGGAASRLETRYECVTPARIVVRVRAVFGARKSLRRDPRSGSLSAQGTVRESYVAARTLRGRPLIFASMRRSGRARLFMVASCVEDAN
jgi:hypothetical protein